MDDTQNGGLVTRISAWLKRPFTDDMDVFHWFLFLGMSLVLTFLWTRIIFYINKGIEL